MPSFPLEIRLNRSLGPEAPPGLPGPIVTNERLPDPVFPQHPEFLTDEPWPGDGERLGVGLAFLDFVSPAPLIGLGYLVASGFFLSIGYKVSRLFGVRLPWVRLP